jgi:hypothetical protein
MRTLKYSAKVLILLVLIAGYGCLSSASENGGVENTGYFRGYLPGMEPDSVLKRESIKPTVKSDTLLVFEHPLTISGEETQIRSYLAFDAYGLFEVQVDCYPEGEEGIGEIFAHWSTKLSEVFGEPDTIASVKRWTTFSRSNHKVEISLSMERDASDDKFVSLNYLEPMDDAY